MTEFVISGEIREDVNFVSVRLLLDQHEVLVILKLVCL